MPRCNRTARLLLAAAAAGTLAGCAGNAIISNENYLPIYNPGEHVASGGTLPVFVFGSPFGEPIDRFGGEVIDAMQGWAFARPDTRFVAPGQSPPNTYRVALVFDSSAFAPSLCSSPLTRVETSAQIPSASPVPPLAGATGSPAPAGARAPLVAALCRGDTAMAWAAGTVPTAGGADGAAFRRGIGQFTAALFPSQNPDNLNNGRDGGGFD